MVDVQLILEGLGIYDSQNDELIANWSGDQTSFNTQDVTSISSPSDGDTAYHDGTGTLPQVLCKFDGNNWRIVEAVSFSYTGDGSTGRTIASDFQFEKVVVQEGGGTAVESYVGGLSNGTLSGNSFSGELTVESSGGFTVGDNSADSDPNTNTETYEVYAV